MKTTRHTHPRPPLKWAGGKRQLLFDLRRRVAMTRGFGRYHEPFVGGGALFFSLYRDGAIGGAEPFLTDNNPRLIEVYQGLRDAVEEVIRLLEGHSVHHGEEGEEYYYAVRAAAPASLAERAARHLNLNRTCFNGLYRENSRGEFNVPFGRYKNPRICDAENLRAVSAALQTARVACDDFARVAEVAQPGDFVYFDPPYHPVSKTASFTAYHRGGFGEAEQRRLAGVFRTLTENGVRALLSNSWTPLVRELYAPWTIEEVFATRNVNSKADARGKVSEALVRNYSHTGRLRRG